MALMVGAVDDDLNPCAVGSLSSGTGFKAIDSTNRVTYVECFDYEIIQSYECQDGSYFEEQSMRCIPGVWVNPNSSGTVSTQTGNVCSSIFDGSVAIDASIYVVCLNYMEVDRYSCPEGFYFDEGQQQCLDKNTSASLNEIESTQPSTLEGTSTESPALVDKTTITCNDKPDGRVPLPTLQGWALCDNDNILVTEYCGTSKLYDIEDESCVNYCERRSNLTGTTISLVQLPKLAGIVTCEDGTVVESIICSAGTYFDANVGYCLNFCENEIQEYISFQHGGFTCQNGNTVAVEWCDSGSSYNALIGLCVQTSSPTSSPITTSPTKSVLETAAPTLASLPPTMQPTLDLELVVVVPDTIPVKNVTELVDVEDNGTANLYSRAHITLSLLLLVKGLTLCCMGS